MSDMAGPSVRWVTCVRSYRLSPPADSAPRRAPMACAAAPAYRRCHPMTREMTMTLQRSPLGVALAGALLALTLAGCERHDTTAARPGDDTRAAQRNADERHADASQAIDQARERARAGGRDLGEAARSAGD